MTTPLKRYGIHQHDDVYYNTSPFFVTTNRADGVSLEMYESVTPTVHRAKPKPEDLEFMPTGYRKTDIRKHYREYTRGYDREWWNDGVLTQYSRYRYIRSSYECAFLPIADPNPDFRIPAVDLMNDLLSEARADAVNYANSLGEFKQTSGMFSAAIDKCYRGLLQFSRSPRQAAITVLTGSIESSWKKISRRLRRKYPMTRGKRAIGKFTGSASDYWLLYHFGVETLVRDVNDSVIELQNSDKAKRPHITRAMVSAKNVGESAYPVGLPDPAGRRAVRTETYRTTKRLSLVAINDSPLAAWISDHGLVNPLSLAWELTTLSWAADYFIGVGKFLEALDAPLYWGRVACWETVKSSIIYHDVYTGNGSYIDDLARPDFFASCTQTSRLASREVRVPHAVLPQWNPRISTIRGVTLAALFSQLVRKRSRI